MSELRQAAQAVVDRWDTPLWKDAPHTAEFIDRLRAALARSGQAASGSSQGARSDEQGCVSCVTCGQPEAPTAAPLGTVWRKHELKTDPEVFQAVLDGTKTYEIRLNDRGFAVGDVLVLRETLHTGRNMAMGSPMVYTGRTIERRVSHMLTGPIYGLVAGWSILSLAAHPPARSGAAPKRDHCPEKLKPGGCQLHNLHCGYPKCNEAPVARSGAGSEEGSSHD